MGNFFSLENPFFQGLYKIAELILLNIIWLVFCVPLFTAGASMSAFYYTIQKCLKNDRGTVWGCFWESFRKNYKLTWPISLIFVAITVVMVMDISIIRYLNVRGVLPTSMAQVVFFIIELVMLVYASWTFWLIARFEVDTRKQAMKNALLIATGHFPVSLVIAGVMIGVLLVIYIIPATAFIMPGVGVWLVSILTEKVFRLYMQREDKELDDELNMRYHNDYDEIPLQERGREQKRKSR